MEQQTTFIPDGMNAIERNVKRIFSFIFNLLYSCET